MPDLTDDDLDLIEARADAALEGPWEPIYTSGTDEVSIRIEGEPDYFYTEICSTSQWPDEAPTSPTAEFIAAARTDVPLLVAEVRRLRAVIASG